MTNRLILVDTSVWVDYLRHGTSREAEVLDRLLSLGLIVTCDPIKAEIVSGAVTKSEFQKLRSLLDSLVFLKAPDNIWRSIEE